VSSPQVGPLTTLADIVRSQAQRNRQDLPVGTLRAMHPVEQPAQTPTASPYGGLDTLMTLLGGMLPIQRQSAADDFMRQMFGLPPNPLAPMALGVMPGSPNPMNLPLTKVMSGGRATQVYHGTPSVFDQFKKGANDPDSLYGPGFYFTENPKIASGYAKTQDTAAVGKSLGRFWTKEDADALAAKNDDAIVRVGPDDYWHVYERTSAPNVRPAHLDITKPFEIEAKADPTVLKWIQGKVSDGTLDSLLGGVGQSRKLADGTNERLYTVLHRLAGDKEKANVVLRSLGFDGITHIGGGRTGNAPHRVWIAFDEKQILSPYREGK
jgi:hypothetical protein